MVTTKLTLTWSIYDSTALATRSCATKAFSHSSHPPKAVGFIPFSLTQYWVFIYSLKLPTVLEVPENPLRSAHLQNYPFYRKVTVRPRPQPLERGKALHCKSYCI